MLPNNVDTLENDNGVRVYSDFDGTATKLAGRPLFLQAPYKAIYQDIFKKPNREEMINAMKQHIPSHPEMEMRPGAVDAIRKMLDANIKFTFVSKNNQKYIEALLSYSGLTDAEIKKITIIDTEQLGKEYTNAGANAADLGYKGSAVYNAEKGKSNGICIAIDDDKKDLNSAERGLQKAAVSTDKKIETCYFDADKSWDKICENALEKQKQLSETQSKNNIEAKQPPVEEKQQKNVIDDVKLNYQDKLLEQVDKIFMADSDDPRVKCLSGTKTDKLVYITNQKDPNKPEEAPVKSISEISREYLSTQRPGSFLIRDSGDPNGLITIDIKDKSDRITSFRVINNEENRKIFPLPDSIENYKLFRKNLDTYVKDSIKTLQKKDELINDFNNNIEPRIQTLLKMNTHGNNTTSKKGIALQQVKDNFQDYKKKIENPSSSSIQIEDAFVKLKASVVDLKQASEKALSKQFLGGILGKTQVGKEAAQVETRLDQSETGKRFFSPGR